MSFAFWHNLVRWPDEVLQHGIRGDFRLVFAPQLIDEAKQKFQQRFPNYLAQFEAVMHTTRFELVANPSRDEIFANRDLMTDVKDVPIALAAINGQVDYFVSEDKHLTACTEHNAKLHEQLNVMLSGTFLRVAMGWSREELEAVRGRQWSDFDS